MRRESEVRRLAFVAAAAAVCAFGWPCAAYADPQLAVSGVRQETGFVEFYLSGHDLPAAGGLTTNSITVTTGSTKLPATIKTVSATEPARLPKRLVVMVLDTSGSMTGAPLDAAKAAAGEYVDSLPSDVQVAIVTAAYPAQMLLPPTGDRARTHTAIGGLEANGETALYDAIAAASTMFRQDYADQRVLVLSDGTDTKSKATIDGARKAVGSVPVDTIAFNSAEATKTILSGLSSATKGHGFQAGDAQALRTAFVQAAGTFSTLVLVHVDVPTELEGQEVRLDIAAVLGDAVVRTDVTLTLVPDTQSATQIESKVSEGLPLWQTATVLGVVFLTILGVAFLVVMPAMAASQKRRRLAQIDRFSSTSRKGLASPAGIEADNAVAQAALQMSQQVMRQIQVEGRLARELDQAGMRIRPHEWLLIRFLVLAGSAVVFALLIRPLVLGFVLGAIFGAAATAFYHRNRAARRFAKFEEQLPEALQLIIGSLRSGFSLAQSVDATTREMEEPLGAEFGRAVGETRLGADIEDALDRVAVRMKSRDLAFAIIAMRVQRHVGGNLTDVLTTTVNTMRERAMLHRQVRALSAEGRLSAYILIALPIVVLLYMLVIRGAYMVPLVTTPIGIGMALFGAVELGLGIWWMLKVVKVEV
jgi:tight adherence protein B